MGYDFAVTDYYTIKFKEKNYPWPWRGDSEREILIFDDDILTKQNNGKFMKHTGLGCLNIAIPKDDVIHHENKTANMRLL